MQMNTDIKNALLNYAHDHNNSAIHAYGKNDEFMKYVRIIENSQCTKRNIAVETIKSLLPVCASLLILLIENLTPKLEKEINKRL